MGKQELNNDNPNNPTRKIIKNEQSKTCRFPGIYRIFLMSLKSLLSEARRKRQSGADGSSSVFNFEHAFQDFSPDFASEMSDIFSYSEASVLFGQCRASFARRNGTLCADEAAVRETQEAALHALLEHGDTARDTCVFAEPLLEMLLLQEGGGGGGKGKRGNGNDALALNIVLMLLALFPEQMRLHAARAMDAALRLLTRFAEGDVSVPIKKTMLLLWRATALALGSNHDIDKRKADLRGQCFETREI